MRLVFATDLHGNRKAYEGVLAAAVTHGCRAVVLGGDLLPKRGIVRDAVAEQRTFAEGWLAPLVRRFRAEHAGVDVLWLMGNDDHAKNEDVFLALDAEGVARYLHGRVVTLDGVAFAGSSFVPITPFGLKDWERFDTEGAPAPLQLGKPTVSLAELATRPTIEAELAALPRATVYVIHGPPHGGKLDVTSRREHVGSKALRRFLEERAPAFSLHGHIHESPRMTGATEERVGSCLAINPGASERTLAAVFVEVS